ncbi:MAG TPA: hypothetical protein VNS50_10055 [Ginsengibacter sp.]|nr:hypothetical protein [Ginsengibacter sp.]
MLRTIFTFLLIIGSNYLFAQYVHYSDNRIINKPQPQQTETKPVASPELHVVDTVRDTVRIIVRDTIRVTVRDTIRITDTLKITVKDTIRLAPVYHKWPDRCPGLSGAVPVLTNYVPKEIVPKLTEIYKGHLYSITTVKVANGKVEYKMKVCENGEIKFEYADENGDLISR